ncbi:uncharacterized protein LOC126323792 isoform X1 [Schistocerca gregaria]|uniref:uncharacterized protein LOC126323792 isoform X1 n=1 Tax=Schistocerca gregaria TaxID=7010 RepID=UPI00211DF633|nr:uncharacterized protein LOC126323792 isoform X1 [Schistocerca gregaria]
MSPSDAHDPLPRQGEPTKTQTQTVFFNSDKQRYVFCLLGTYPLSLIYRRLPDRPVLKHLYGLVLGLLMCYLISGNQLVHHLFTSVVVYWITESVPPKLIGHSVLAFSLFYLMLCHTYRMYVDYLGWSIDFTGTQMLLTIKFVMYAFDYQDMKTHAFKLEPSSPARKQLLSYMQHNRLLRKPSLLEYFSYMFWYSNILAGPTLPPRVHFEFVELSMFPNKKVPAGSYKRGFLVGLYGILMGLPLLLQKYLPLSRLLDGSLNHLPVICRSLYLWIAVILYRCPYYFAWLLLEGSNIIIGIGWSGYSNPADPSSPSLWDRASSVRPLALETSKSFKDITDNWNLSANRWLKYYIYLRYKEFLGVYSTYFTYLVSSIWHGLYPGYYLSFGLCAFATEFYREIYRKVRIHFLDPQGREPMLYRTVLTLLTSYVLSYCLVAFILLSWGRSIHVYSSLYWHGHVFLILGLLLFKLVPYCKKK